MPNLNDSIVEDAVRMATTETGRGKFQTIFISSLFNLFARRLA